MIRTPSLPTWWQHPNLKLHRQWFSRRAFQIKARAVLIAVAGLLLAIWILGASPFWLLLALLGLLMPSSSYQSTLQEIEKTTGAAYTTALTAQTDMHGFKNRLDNMALTVQKNTELPPLPWLETLGMAVLLSLLLVLPTRGLGSQISAEDRTISRESLENPNTPNGSSSSSAEPILDAPSRDAPPAGADAKPGQAASGGSASEQNLGELKPGGGSATESPEAISKEFLEALERGAVRDRDPNKEGSPDGQVEDANPPTAGQSGSEDGKSDGQNGSGNNQNDQNGQQSANQNGQNGQPNNQNGQNGQPNNQNGQSGAQGDQNGQNGQSGANQAGNGTQGNQPKRDPRGNNLDRGEDTQGFDPQNPNSQGNRSTSPGNGAKDANGNPVAANRQSGKGKLEYLQGTAKGNNVRSGALQLPGDPTNGFTSPTGSASYRRAAESAVLDPRLPPEYQEMLKNYYR